MSFFSKSNISFYARCYYTLRVHLHKSRWLLRLAQILHAHVLLGPLRKPAVRYYQKFSNNQPLVTNTYPIFPHMDLDQVVKRVNETGYDSIGNIPEEYIKQITKYCEINNQVRYWNPHKNCEAVERICHNNIVVEIARRYLGVEPILWLSQLIWSFPPSDDRFGFNKSMYREPVKYDPNMFHYDAIDFKSLTLFVYLTDVDSDSSAHTVVEGTHVNKTFKEINNIILDDKVVQEKFGDRIKVISGKRGTAFIEETSACHKVEICKDRRLILSIDYVLRRQVPPERPTKVTGHDDSKVAGNSCPLMPPP